MAEQERGHRVRRDEGGLKLLRSKGPDPLGMSSMGCLSGARKSSELFFANEYNSCSVIFYVNVRA